jgi:hypothetical protein
MNVIAIPKKLIREVNSAAKTFGLSKEDFLANAILYYLKNIKGEVELKKKLEAWEKASGDDFFRFERKI